MRRFHTAPMLVLSDVPYGDFSLEPYEAGWASEAIAFLYIRKLYGACSITLQPQISEDGARWIDFGASIGPITEATGYYIQLTHFGNWIRLSGRVNGNSGDGSPAFVGDFYWSLKE